MEAFALLKAARAMREAIHWLDALDPKRGEIERIVKRIDARRRRLMASGAGASVRKVSFGVPAHF